MADDPSELELYGPGIDRVLGTCAAWLRGIQRHQIRQAMFDALIAGGEFSVHVMVASDGVVRGTFLLVQEDHEWRWSGTEEEAAALGAIDA